MMMIWMIDVVLLQLESAELDRDRQRIELQKLAAEAEVKERCLHEEMEEKVCFSDSIFYAYFLFFVFRLLWVQNGCW